MAETKADRRQFQEKENESDSSDGSFVDEKQDAASDSGSSDEGEYDLDSGAEEKSNSLQECDRNQNAVRNGDVPAPKLPSNVLDKEYIWMPRSFENFEEREEWKSSGKWLIYIQGDLQKLDHLWLNLRPLLADDTLICIKSSTGTDRSKGVIMCYTSNCEDKRAVKKAADAIRHITSDNDMLYYKTNEASDSGLYKADGATFITKYMHSVAGSLYERDEYNRWKKLFLDSDEDGN